MVEFIKTILNFFVENQFIQGLLIGVGFGVTFGIWVERRTGTVRIEEKRLKAEQEKEQRESARAAREEAFRAQYGYVRADMAAHNTDGLVPHDTFPALHDGEGRLYCAFCAHQRGLCIELVPCTGPVRICPRCKEKMTEK